ncbi:MAG: hypothetical protein M3H12_14145, partial [Chromatiales bacterium]|nr:hypothetical protein [Gammaproteobacteria bacterium]
RVCCERPTPTADYQPSFHFPWLAAPELTLKDLCPVMELVARSRGLYLKELFEVTEISGDKMPSQDQIGRLKKLRENFEELVKGAQSLETAIERGYLDVNR